MFLAREGLVYLDSAATSQTPRRVVEAMERYYYESRGTVHRSVYPLAVEATELFEGARERIAAFAGWTPRETVLTRNATESPASFHPLFSVTVCPPSEGAKVIVCGAESEFA